MGKKTGMLRLLFVFFVSALLSVCGIYGRFLKSTDSVFKNVENNNFEEISTEVVEAEITENYAPENNKAKKKENESVTVSAVGNVKGKIISKYISPYTAGLYYDRVYVKNSTELKIDIKSLLSSPLGFKVEKSDSPQVLIMHTHTTETYMPEASDYYTDAYSSRTRDKNKNMVSVGEIVTQKLNNAGIKALHDTTEHDYPKYTGSYGRAAKTITGYLKKYPSIKIVLDLHRDAVASGDSDKVKLVTEINGKKAAQVMLVMGSQSGEVTNFPNWKENLKLAVRLQKTLETEYPTLARPLSLTSKNYNQSLTTGSLLIEFGTDANSLEEAHYSAELVGNALVKLLNNLG